MSQKIKISFWTILVLIIMNCGVVFADASNDFDYVIQNNIPSFYNTEYYTEASNSLIGYENLVVISRYYFSFPGSEGDQVTNRTYYTQFYIYGSNNLSYFDKSNYNAVVTPPPVMYLYIEFNHNTGYITFRNYGEKTTKQSFQMQNDSNRKIVFSTKDINYYNSSNIYYPATDTYKKPYYEITLDYKGQSSIQANGEKVKAYTYDSIYDTGITNIGNKFLKLGYLYIDDSYTISNLLTSVPIMTKYSMNLLNNWEYTLYEGIYTTGEKENGYLKYEIRIPIEDVSTPNYYNIFFRSRDTEIQEDINIDFVLLNNTENSGTIGPIVTPSGDIISGDSIKDETTLGDINNTINNLENKLENVILGTENESGDREGGLLGGILDGIKGLFIPSEEAMGEWLTRTQQEVSDKLGILGEPINFFSRLMNKLLVENTEDFVLHIPELIIPGTEYKLLDAFDINLTQMINEHSVFKTIYDGYIAIISGIMVYCFYSYLWSFYDHLLGTRDVEAAYKIAEEEVERQQLIQKERKRQPIGFKTKGDNRK